MGIAVLISSRKLSDQRCKSIGLLAVLYRYTREYANVNMIYNDGDDDDEGVFGFEVQETIT